jgi:hypothetical protein
VLKVCDLKVLCPSQLHGSKDWKIKVGIQIETDEGLCSKAEKRKFQDVLEVRVFVAH